MGDLLDLAKGDGLGRGPLQRWVERASVSLDQYAALNGGLAYLTQPSWFVSALGSVNADGASAASPIPSAELTRRFSGRVLAQNTTVQFLGSFPNDTLALNCLLLDPFNLVLKGDAPTQVYAGSVGAYTKMSAPAQDPRISDAGRSFAGDAGRRGRITSGARKDVQWWFAKDLGGNAARIAQPITPVDATSQLPFGFEGAPAPGDAYAIETLVTQFHKFTLDVFGGGQLLVQDMAFVGTDSVTDWVWCPGPGQAAFQGCQFTGTPLLSGNPVFNSCSFVPQTQWDGPLFGFTRGGIFFGPALVLNGFLQLSLNPIFQSVPNIGGESALAPSRNTYVMVSGNSYSGNGGAFFGDCTNTDALVGVSRGATMEVRSNATLFGSGNTSPVGVHAFTNSRFTYDGAAPTLTGNVPGQDVSVGGTLTTWAAIDGAGGVLNTVNAACVARRA